MSDPLPVLTHHHKVTDANFALTVERQADKMGFAYVITSQHDAMPDLCLPLPWSGGPPGLTPEVLIAVALDAYQARHNAGMLGAEAARHLSVAIERLEDALCRVRLLADAGGSGQGPLDMPHSAFGLELHDAAVPL